MSLTLIATPGASNANSYITLAEALTYFESRPFSTAWEDADSQEALLVWATRTLDAALSGNTEYFPPSGDRGAYIKTGPKWTGVPSTSTQALAWPRSGMLNRNGFAIGESAIPQELKDAVAELAGQMAKSDRTSDNDVSVQGITALRAGPVSLSFKNDGISVLKVLPNIVMSLLVPSWYTTEFTEGTTSVLFDVIS